MDVDAAQTVHTRSMHPPLESYTFTPQITRGHKQRRGAVWISVLVVGLIAALIVMVVSQLDAVQSVSALDLVFIVAAGLVLLLAIIGMAITFTRGSRITRGQAPAFTVMSNGLRHGGVRYPFAGMAHIDCVTGSMSGAIGSNLGDRIGASTGILDGTRHVHCHWRNGQHAVIDLSPDFDWKQWESMQRCITDVAARAGIPVRRHGQIARRDTPLGAPGTDARPPQRAQW